MSEIVSTTFDLGVDAWDRRVTATRKRHYSGVVLWSVKIDAANQRDDEQEIEGMTDDNVRALYDSLRALGLNP